MLEMDEHAVWRAEDDGDGDGINIPPPPPSCSTKLNSWAKWLALLIRPAPAQRWWHESHGSAQANGQIVNVEPSAKLTCQTDYMSWPQPKATQTTDGRTD